MHAVGSVEIAASVTCRCFPLAMLALIRLLSSRAVNLQCLITIATIPSALHKLRFHEHGSTETCRLGSLQDLRLAPTSTSLSQYLMARHQAIVWPKNWRSPLLGLIHSDAPLPSTALSVQAWRFTPIHSILRAAKSRFPADSSRSLKEEAEYWLGCVQPADGCHVRPTGLPATVLERWADSP